MQRCRREPTPDILGRCGDAAAVATLLLCCAASFLLLHPGDVRRQAPDGLTPKFALRAPEAPLQCKVVDRYEARR